MPTAPWLSIPFPPLSVTNINAIAEDYLCSTIIHNLIHLLNRKTPVSKKTSMSLKRRNPDKAFTPREENNHPSQNPRSPTCPPSHGSLPSPPPSVILRQIHELLNTTVQAILVHDTVPVIEVPSRTLGNTSFCARCHRLVSGDMMIKRSLLDSQSRLRYVQMWVVMSRVSRTVMHSTNARALWYELKPTGLFPRPESVQNALSDVAALLGVPRMALGVISGSRGIVYGPVQWSIGSSPWNLAPTPNAVAIPSEMADTRAQINWRLEPGSHVELLVVVEKESVAERLIGLGLPWIIVSGRGMPDFPSRAMVARLCHVLGTQFPGIPAVVITDLNPHGLNIALAYRVGTTPSWREGIPWAAPALEWIGAHPRHVQDPSGWQTMTTGDMSILRNTLDKHPGMNSLELSRWKAEGEVLNSLGAKAELEATFPPQSPWVLTAWIRREVEALRHRAAVEASSPVEQ